MCCPTSRLILLGIAEVKDKPQQLLKDYGATRERILNAMQVMRAGKNVSGEEAEALATEIGAVMYVETSSLRQLGVRYACSAGWYCAHNRPVVAR